MLHFPMKCLSCWARARVVAWRNIISQRVCVHPAAELRSLRVPRGTWQLPLPSQAAWHALTCGCWDTQAPPPPSETPRGQPGTQHPCKGRRGSRCLRHNQRVLHGKAFWNIVISSRSWIRIFQFFFFKYTAYSLVYTIYLAFLQAVNIHSFVFSFCIGRKAKSHNY